MTGCEIVSTTPNGNAANVNTRIGVGSQRAYLTYRRASETSPHNSLAVIDICVIFTNKVRKKVYGNFGFVFKSLLGIMLPCSSCGEIQTDIVIWAHFHRAA